MFVLYHRRTTAAVCHHHHSRTTAAVCHHHYNRTTRCRPVCQGFVIVTGIPPERRSGISINTISAAGEASSAVGTTSHPEEERLSDLLRLSNPYLEKRRRTFMMALSSAGIDWPPQRKCSRSPAADAGTTMSQAQGGGGSCVPNMDLLGGSSESMLNFEDIHISN